MTQLQQTNILTERTHEVIKHLVEGKTHEEIAKAMGVSRSTITRELRECRDNGELQTWAEDEFLRLHGEQKIEDKKECYRALTALIRKSDSVKVEQNYTEIKLTWLAAPECSAAKVRVVASPTYDHDAECSTSGSSDSTI